MTSSAYICHKLIDDIIKRGGQQVSDHYVIKTCLDRTVLSNKKLISNELVKQTGIKSQFCTINTQLASEQQPKAIRKDEFMYKSVGRIQRKIRIKQAEDSRKCVSTSKIRPKDQKFKTCSTFITKPSISTVKPNKKIEISAQLIQLEDIKLARKVSVKQEKKDEEMRNNWLKEVQDQMEYQKTSKILNEQAIAKKGKAKKNFERQFSAATSDHTYHTDGTFIVYSLKSKQKCISNAFPPAMNPFIGKQENVIKKVYKKPPQLDIKLSKNQQDQSSRNIHRESKQSVYNNNNQRQTNSVDFLNIKPGICFTELSSGQSVRGQRENQQEATLVRHKRSAFSKFFTKDDRTKTETFVNFCKDSLGKKLSFTPKTQLIVCGDQMQNLSKRHKTVRSRASRPTGRIIDINQSLRQRLITH